MKTKVYKIGDYFQISEFVRLYIEDIEIELDLDDNKITLLFMCLEINSKNESGSDIRPFLQSQIEYLIKKYHENN
jgi:hypothetical protein